MHGKMTMKPIDMVVLAKFLDAVGEELMAFNRDVDEVAIEQVTVQYSNNHETWDLTVTNNGEGIRIVGLG